MDDTIVTHTYDRRPFRLRRLPTTLSAEEVHCERWRDLPDHSLMPWTSNDPFKIYKIDGPVHLLPPSKPPANNPSDWSALKSATKDVGPGRWNIIESCRTLEAINGRTLPILADQLPLVFQCSAEGLKAYAPNRLLVIREHSRGQTEADFGMYLNGACEAAIPVHDDILIYLGITPGPGAVTPKIIPTSEGHQITLPVQEFKAPHAGAMKSILRLAYSGDITYFRYQLTVPDFGPEHFTPGASARLPSDSFCIKSVTSALLPVTREKVIKQLQFTEGVYDTLRDLGITDKDIWDGLDHAWMLLFAAFYGNGGNS